MFYAKTTLSYYLIAAISIQDDQKIVGRDHMKSK